MSPLEYVQALRLEETKHLLETTDQPIEAIANQVGYEDSSFFGRLFRRKVGLTPARYRKRFQGLRNVLKHAPTGAQPVEVRPGAARLGIRSVEHITGG
jgi:AraC-like DNA-binding protein